eukprot:gene49252-51126_t
MCWSEEVSILFTVVELLLLACILTRASGDGERG